MGDRVWLFGGIGGDENATAETAAYDRAINTWTPGPKLPLPLHHASAVTYDGEAVVIGGFIPGEELTSEQSDRVYALRGGSWERLPPLNHPRAAAAAAVVGDKIVVVGGQANGKLVPQTEVFDGERWTDVADIPTPREHLGAASDGRYLYARRRPRSGAAKNLATLERYDPGRRHLDELGRHARQVGSVGAAYVAGLVIAVGGEGVTEPSDAVQAFDVESKRWSELPPLPAPRHGVAVGTLEDSLYAIGGAAAAGHVQATGHGERARLRLRRQSRGFSAAGFGACVELSPMYVTCIGLEEHAPVRAARPGPSPGRARPCRRTGTRRRRAAGAAR